MSNKLRKALDKPMPDTGFIGEEGRFDPWEDVIQGIDGCYSSESDRLMIATLKAVRDKTTFDLIQKRGFAAEFMLYVLSGHGYTEYGTSPRGGWPDPEYADMWQELIDKWQSFAKIAWKDWDDL